MPLAPCTLSAEDRERIRAAVAGLTGKERHREYMRLRSRALRENESYRAADNARKAARGRERYQANPEESRRKGAEKWRRARLAQSRAGASAG